MRNFRELLFDGNTRFSFNLDGVDVWGGLAGAVRGGEGFTDRELLLIKQNPLFWGRITWIKNGQIVPNPFQ